MYLPVPGFEPTSSEFLDKCLPAIGHSGRYQFQDQRSSGVVLSSFKSNGRTVCKLESKNQNLLDEHMPKTGKRTDTNFNSTLILVMSNHSFNWTECR